jgi:hypothetical protein
MRTTNKILLLPGGAFNPNVPAGQTKIYGVSWDGSSSPTLTRTDNAVGMVANAGVDAGVVVNNFDNAEIYRNISTVTGILGNVFVCIPKFYIEKTVVGAACTWRISRTSFSAACYVPKCFGSGGWAYIGAYNAGLSAGKLNSVSGVYPYVNDTIVNMRTYAQANGAGYQLLDIHAVDVLQVLFLVEFATLNSQSIMAGLTTGAYSASHVATATETAANRVVVANATAALFVVGQSIGCGSAIGNNSVFNYRTITSITVVDGSNKALNFDGASANVAIGNIVYSLGWKSGSCDAIVAKSGCQTNLTNGLYPCMYRGIENPWGSVWQFVDGVNIAADYQAWVCPTPASYASNLFAAPYEVLSYANGNASGWIKTLGFDAAHPYAQFSITVAGGADATHYYSDYYYKGTGNIIALFGGPWYYGTNAGAFCSTLAYASTTTNLNIAGRLSYKN